MKNIKKVWDKIWDTDIQILCQIGVPYRIYCVYSGWKLYCAVAIFEEPSLVVYRVAALLSFCYGTDT